MSKKLYKKVKFKTREEWLRNRAFGGSSISALFDCNPYMTKTDLYCAIVNPPKSDDDIKGHETANTIYGKEVEDIIRELVKLNFKGKYKVIAPKGYEMYVRKDKPFISATIDGRLIEENTGRKGVLEIKSYEFRGNDDLEENWGTQPPLRYSLQTLHYLMTLNDFDFAKLVVKIRWLNYDTNEVIKEEMRYYHFERADNQATIDEIERVETDFYENNVLTKTPPNINLDIFKESEE